MLDLLGLLGSLTCTYLSSPILRGSFYHLFQIPDKVLDSGPQRPASIAPEPSPAALEPENPLEETEEPEDDGSAIAEDDASDVPPIRPITLRHNARRLSTYESSDGGMDLESDEIGGSARPRHSRSISGSV